MKLLSFCVYLGLWALLLLAPPVLPRRSAELRMIDAAGRDTPCPPSFARLHHPARRRPAAGAIVEDLASSAAAAGPLGLAGMLLCTALLALLAGLWSGGMLGGLRRLLVCFALGVPIGLGLLYASCFLEGRSIRLGPDAAGYVKASLHTQTDRSTGLLSPADLVRWHYRRGFRVLNVADKDSGAAGRMARKAAQAAGYVPSLLVLVGEEWHGHPHVVFVGIRRDRDPRDLDLDETLAAVHAEGGAAILAHPWSKMRLTLDEALEREFDGIEVVNERIEAGHDWIEAAARRSKALVGSLDYKYGPHENVVTLLPAKAARTARGVVRALRDGRTRVLYAVPGGALTPETYRATRAGINDTVAGFRTLLQTPRKRRATWLFWLALGFALWRLAIREERRIRRGKPLSARAARLLLGLCAAGEFLLPVALSWQVRAWVGTIPVRFLLGAGALLAVPLLAASQVLAREGSGTR